MAAAAAAVAAAAMMCVDECGMMTLVFFATTHHHKQKLQKRPQPVPQKQNTTEQRFHFFTPLKSTHTVRLCDNNNVSGQFAQRGPLRHPLSYDSLFFDEALHFPRVSIGCVQVVACWPPMHPFALLRTPSSRARACR